jgi:hypothetical protein
LKVNPQIVWTHCFLHREALASKAMGLELRKVLDTAIQIINYIKASAKNNRIFTTICEEMGSDHKSLLLHTEVRWLSKGNIKLKMMKKLIISLFKWENRSIDFTSYGRRSLNS